MNNFLGSFLNITLQGDVVVEDDLEKDELLFLLLSAVGRRMFSISF